LQSGFQFFFDTLLQVDEWRVKEQTLERLSAIQPLLSEIMDVKLVVQPRKNMINIRVKPEYATLVWHKELEGVRYCFFMSDKLEPYIIITALSATGTRCVDMRIISTKTNRDPTSKKRTLPFANHALSERSVSNLSSSPPPPPLTPSSHPPLPHSPSSCRCSSGCFPSPRLK
jgi:transcriptional regulator of heat shock response